MAKKKTKRQKANFLYPSLIILIIILVAVGAKFYFASSDKTSKQVGNEFIQTNNLPTDTPYPTQPPSKPGDVFEIIPVSTMWDSGTLTFIYPGVDISFKYPSKMILNSIDITKSNKEYEERYHTHEYIYDELAIFTLNTPGVANIVKARPDFDWDSYGNNSVHILLAVDDNKDNLSINDFLKKTKAKPGMGNIPIYKSFEGKLSPLNISGHEAYSYFGAGGGEVYKKIVFIPHKNKVYTFSMTGGNDTGSIFSHDAENLFDKIIQSIELK